MVKENVDNLLFWLNFKIILMMQIYFIVYIWKFCQYIFCNIFIGIVAQSSRLLYIQMYTHDLCWLTTSTVGLFMGFLVGFMLFNFLVFSVVFRRSPLLQIVLSVLLQFTASDYFPLLSLSLSWKTILSCKTSIVSK
jgi:uncharacterized protein YacL